MLQEARHIHNIMLLFMKLRSSEAKWTIEEISQLKSHMKHLVLCVTIILIFALPFGLLLLPLYTELLDRREKRRIRDTRLHSI
jgi:hypothetical protein